MTRQIRDYLQNDDFEVLISEMAGYYVVFHSDVEANAELISVFDEYLARDDYFAADLRLEIDRQRNLESEESYKLKHLELVKRYSEKLKLSSSDNDQHRIDSIIKSDAEELDRVDQNLKTLKKIAFVTKDIVVPISGLICSILLVVFGYIKMRIDTGKDRKENSIIVVPTAEDIKKYG